MKWLADLVKPKPDNTAELQRLVRLHNLIEKARDQATHVKIHYSYFGDYATVVNELESSRIRISNRMRALKAST
jgi:hypothetical protein